MNNKNKGAMGFTAKDFGDSFVWGVSTAAYQIEGAYKEDDKGLSIWDVYTNKKGNTHKNENANTSCDFFNRYKEDILLMKAMNIKHFRFSISWSRVLPNGEGEVSASGLNFYNKLIDFCLENGITPWITLYHWDLPQALEDQGGWTNRKILDWFAEFTRICATSFGDRVNHWMVLNEPMVFTGAGYFLGVHAPGKKRLKNFLPAVHHAVLCQAIGGRLLRKLVVNATIGTTFSCSQLTPYSNKKKDVLAANRADAVLNRLFIEPLLGMGYPIKEMPVLKRIQKYCFPGDMEMAVFNFDFIGVQNYTREVVRHNRFVPYIKAKIIKATKRNVQTTLMDWEVYPPCIFNMIAKFNAYDGVNNILITESGAAFTDFVNSTKEVEDCRRSKYLQDHLEQILKAKNQGLKVSGYFVWTFTDNFEWSEGYHPRFGLVYVDFTSQKRIIKKSGKWFANFINTSGLIPI